MAKRTTEDRIAYSILGVGAIVLCLFVISQCRKPAIQSANYDYAESTPHEVTRQSPKESRTPMTDESQKPSPFASLSKQECEVHDYMFSRFKSLAGPNDDNFDREVHEPLVTKETMDKFGATEEEVDRCWFKVEGLIFKVGEVTNTTTAAAERIYFSWRMSQ